MKTINNNKMLNKIIQTFFMTISLLFCNINTFVPNAEAYPVYAQQGYANPRAANGKIACANCHLAEKPVEIETPQAVLPDSLFEAVVKIPYDKTVKQIQGNGKLGSLNVGAVLVLPEGFKLAPTTRIDKETKEKNKGVYISPYSSTQENILVVGPIGGDAHQEISFPILSPDPKTNKNVHFLNYPIYVGANRGRGQLYPTGEKSNNNMVTALSSGQISQIEKTEKNVVQVDQPLTKDPNVGGFGQTETEIVLQNPLRVFGYMFFTLTVL